MARTPLRAASALAFLTSVLVLPGLRPGASAQEGVSARAPDSLITLGDSLLQVLQADTAAIVFEQALEIDEREPRALAGLGKAQLILRNWSAATDAFNHLHDLDTSSISAHYHLGICYRELGTTKAWLLRTIDWGTAEEHFRAVIARDSTYGDVFFQYALLERYRGEFVRAIELGHRQITIRPDLDRARVGLLQLYRSFISQDRPRSIAWLREQETAIGRYALGEALRRDGKGEEAEVVLRELLYQSRFSLVQPVYLSLARIYIERGEAAAVEGYYLRAIEETVTPLGAEILFEDIKHILSDAEILAFRSLRTPESRTQFFRAFWTVRNPTAGKSNPRIVEHCRRSVHAEENFEYVGFRTEFTNPDRLKYLTYPRAYYLNEEYNDKGLVYLRHGAPDNVVRNIGETQEPGESWLYEGTVEMPRRIYHFVRLNAPGNNWRLVAFPSDPRMIENLSTWDPRFADLLSTQPGIQSRAQDGIIEEETVTVRQGLDTDSHSWGRAITPFPLSCSVEAFRSTGGRSLLDISYAIPLAEIARSIPAERTSVPMEIGIALRSLTGRVAITHADTLSFPVGEAGAESYTGLYRYRVPPDSFSIALSVRPLETNLYGSWGTVKQVPAFQEPGVSLSDIQFLIPSTSRGMLEFDGIKVAPNPYRAHASDQPLYTYCQIYGLTRDADGRSAYDVRFFVTPASSGTGESEIGALMDLSAEDFATVFKALDISDLESGAYTLTVSVTDRKSGAGVRRRRPLEIYEP